MKKLILILAPFIGIFLGIGSPGIALADSSAIATATGGGGTSEPGAIVIAWNQELLHILQKPGAQPVTVHPTRSFAMLHAAIYDSVVSITRDAPAAVFLLNAPHSAQIAHHIESWWRGKPRCASSRWACLTCCAAQEKRCRLRHL